MKRRRLLSLLLTLLLSLCLLVPCAPAAEAAGKQTPCYVSFTEFCGGVAALRSDGTVAIWDPYDWIDEDARVRISRWTDIIEISGCSTSLLGLRSNGTVVAEDCGYGEDLVPVGWHNVSALAGVTPYHSYALGTDGTLKVVGEAAFNTIAKCDFSQMKNLKKVIAGVCGEGEYVVGLRADGTVVGYNAESEACGNWSGKASNIVDIASSGWLDMALRRDGTVIVSGTDRWEVEDSVKAWTDIVQICPGDVLAVGLRRDGTVVSSSEELTARLKGWKNVRELVVGPSNDIAALRADGTVLILPGNSYDLDAATVAKWKNVTRLWLGSGVIIAWQADGNLLSAGIDLDELS